MVAEKSTSSGFPWKGILIVILLILLLLLGFKFKEALDQKEKALSEVRKLTEQTQQQSLRIAGLEKLSNEVNALCTPNVADINEPLAPCAKCVSTINKISPSEAEQAIKLGTKLERIYQGSPDSIQYANFEKQLEEAAKQLMEGKELTFMATNQEALKAKDEEIANLKKQITSSEQSLAENSVLQAELARCLANSNFMIKRTGLDRAPCWVDDEGAVQYLFDITLLEDNKVIVKPAWPASRQGDVDKMSPVKALQPFFGQEMPLPLFLRQAREIHEIGNNNEIQACRFFVRLKSEIPDRITADRARLAVEGVFYKLEKLGK